MPLTDEQKAQQNALNKLVETLSSTKNLLLGGHAQEWGKIASEWERMSSEGRWLGQDIIMGGAIIRTKNNLFKMLLEHPELARYENELVESFVCMALSLGPVSIDRFRNQLLEKRDDIQYIEYASILHHALIALTRISPRNPLDEAKNPKCSLTGNVIAENRKMDLADGYCYDIATLWEMIKRNGFLSPSAENRLFSPYWTGGYEGDMTQYRSPMTGQFFHLIDIERIQEKARELKLSSGESSSAGSSAAVPSSLRPTLPVLGSTPGMMKTLGVLPDSKESRELEQAIKDQENNRAAGMDVFGLTWDQVNHPKFGIHVLRALENGLHYADVINIFPKQLVFLVEGIEKAKGPLPSTDVKPADMIKIMTCCHLPCEAVLAMEPYQIEGIVKWNFTLEEVRKPKFEEIVKLKRESGIMISHRDIEESGYDPEKLKKLLREREKEERRELRR